MLHRVFFLTSHLHPIITEELPNQLKPTEKESKAGPVTALPCLFTMGDRRWGTHIFCLIGNYSRLYMLSPQNIWYRSMDFFVLEVHISDIADFPSHILKKQTVRYQK